MGAALKKNQDYPSLARLRFAAWGVVDIEKLERMQRRNYINHVREELKLHRLQLECGGSTTSPYYRIYEADENAPSKWSATSANYKQGAFARVCREALIRIDPQSLDPEHHNA